MESLPGPDNIWPNIDHRCLRDLQRGYLCEQEQLVYLNNVLNYRASAMQTANKYVSSLGLQFPNGLVFDTETWHQQTPQDKPDMKSARYQQISDFVDNMELFYTPLPCQGLVYAKPEDYLTIALFESNLDFNEIQIAVGWLTTCKLCLARFTATTNMRRSVKFCPRRCIAKL